MESTNILSGIRQAVEKNIGQEVEVTAHRGRKRAQISEGTLDAVYPSIFTIAIQDGANTTRRLSFSYNDVLTHTVELILKKNKQPLSVPLQSSTN